MKLVFASPRVLPHLGKLKGRVAVLDVAFVADELGTSFEGTTRKFISDLGERLAVWVDHHDHDRVPGQGACSLEPAPSDQSSSASST